MTSPFGSLTSSSAQLVVNAAGTGVTWASPAPVTYGEELSIGQLNASAGGIAGTFQYSPQPGTVLPAGQHALQVLFTPTDTNSHSAATGGVSLTVLPATLTVRAQDTNRVVGQGNPAFTLTYSGFVNGDGVGALAGPAVATTTATVGSPPGQYPIAVGGANGANYAITHFNGVLNVVSDIPVITVQPTNQLVKMGASVGFAVQVTGAGPFSYQWRKDGGVLAAGTNATLQLTNVTVADRGVYEVVVSNAFGTVTSEAAALLFTGPPVVIIDQPDRTVAIGDDLELRVVLSGTPPFNSTWYHFVTPLSGATTPVLTLTNLQPEQAGIYQLTAFNSFGNAASRQIRVTVVEPLTIDFATTNYTVLRGQAVELQPMVSGSAPLHFSWFKAGLLLTGETNPLLTIASAQRVHGGLYRAAVSNQVGVASSDDVHLRVLVPAQMNAPARLTDGRFRLQLGASDQVALTGGDLPRLVIESSRDFTNWSTLSSNGAGLTLTNGQVRFDDPGASSLNSRFYRVFER